MASPSSSLAKQRAKAAAKKARKRRKKADRPAFERLTLAEVAWPPLDSTEMKVSVETAPAGTVVRWPGGDEAAVATVQIFDATGTRIAYQRVAGADRQRFRKRTEHPRPWNVLVVLENATGVCHGRATLGG